jgi:hypothetical protein
VDPIRRKRIVSIESPKNHDDREGREEHTRFFVFFAFFVVANVT